VIAPSSVTAIVCTPESKNANSAYVYVGTTNGAIWGWDFRALINHARKYDVGGGLEYRFHEGHDVPDTGGSQYNALLRVKHKMSVLKLRTEDCMMPGTIGFGSVDVEQRVHQKVFQSCEASCVWQAHASVITQVQLLPYPGQIFSVSLDGTIKVWDPVHSCIGTITTVPDHKRKQESAAQSATTQSTTGTVSPSTWKYSHHHHMANASRDQQVRISREMLQRVKRRKLKRDQQERRRSGSHFALSQLRREDEQEEPELAVEKTETPALTPVLAAAQKLLASQIPFSSVCLGYLCPSSLPTDSFLCCRRIATARDAERFVRYGRNAHSTRVGAGVETTTRASDQVTTCTAHARVPETGKIQEDLQSSSARE
jgi:hypothetical protein